MFNMYLVSDIPFALLLILFFFLHLVEILKVMILLTTVNPFLKWWMKLKTD